MKNLESGYKSSRGAINLLTVVGVLFAIAVAGWWLLRTPALEPNQVRVTYLHGETCLWQDWTFRIRREVANNRARGAMLITGPPTIQTMDDKALRIFSSSGAKIFVPPGRLLDMVFESRPNPDNRGNNVVQALTVTTTEEQIRFTATELPRFSRSRVLVPVASYYFPDQDDDYMDWGNVRMTLAGTPVGECSTDREVSLTRPGHPNKRTPARIEFSGSD